MRSRLLITMMVTISLSCTDTSEDTAPVDRLPFASASTPAGTSTAPVPTSPRAAPPPTAAPLSTTAPLATNTAPATTGPVAVDVDSPEDVDTGIAPPPTTTTATSEPPTPTPAPARPPADLQLGVSPGAGIVDVGEDDLARDLDAMVELGITSLRLDFDWSRIQPASDRFAWSATDRVVAAARSRGIAVLGLITYTPAWARPPGTDDKHPPDDAAAFAEFSRRVADRYAPAGVTSWEIWNEPNIAPFWSDPTGPSAERYAGLLTAAAGAIRAVDPDAVIATGGLAPAADRPGASVAPATYLETLLSTVPPGTIDAVALHPYSYPAMPSDGSQSWNPFAQLPEISALIARHHGLPLPIWITEFGAPTGDAARSVSDQDQEAMVLDALGCAAGKEWIGPVFLYTLRDRPGGDPSDVEDHFGLLRSDGAPKPIAKALVEVRTGTRTLVPAEGCAGW